MADEQEGRIVAGTGTIATGRDSRELNKAKEAAMAQAVTDCAEVGITDPATVKQFMLHYKNTVKAGGTVEQARQELVKYAEEKM